MLLNCYVIYKIYYFKNIFDDITDYVWVDNKNTCGYRCK
jgi:hypothetical protein